ncbi:MAG: hypothetical protein LC797_04850 [Chloroflexi bacterium]|nr:hypothetical protein [Chloroflexota bacterium]
MRGLREGRAQTGLLHEREELAVDVGDALLVIHPAEGRAIHTHPVQLEHLVDDLFGTAEQGVADPALDEFALHLADLLGRETLLPAAQDAGHQVARGAPIIPFVDVVAHIIAHLWLGVAAHHRSVDEHSQILLVVVADDLPAGRHGSRSGRRCPA